MRTPVLAAAVALALAAPATASAARPTINLATAEHAARVELHDWASSYNEQIVADNAETTAANAEVLAAGDELTADDLVLEPTITHAGLDEDSCDVETRYRVLCDASIAFSDGTTDDWTFTIITTRKGRYSVDL